MTTKYMVRRAVEVKYMDMTDEEISEVFRLNELKSQYECTSFDEEGDRYVCYRNLDNPDNVDDTGYAVYLKSSGHLLCLLADAGNALEGYEDCEYGAKRSKLYRQIALLAGWPEYAFELKRTLTWRELIDEMKLIPMEFLDTTAYVWDSHRESLEPVTGLKPWEFFLDGSIPGPDVDDNCFYIDTFTKE